MLRGLSVDLVYKVSVECLDRIFVRLCLLEVILSQFCAITPISFRNLVKGDFILSKICRGNWCYG